MSRFLGFAIFISCLLTQTGVVHATVELFVATNGNDRWSGKLAEPNGDQSDGPLATLAAARDAVRELRKEKGSEPIRVVLRGGVYRLAEPVVFGPADSASAGAPTTYVAFAGESPVLSGGREIKGWQKGEGPFWTVTIPQAKKGQWHFRQLFVNGRRATPARTPNSDRFGGDVFKPVGPLRPLGDRNKARKDPTTRLGFKYRGDDLQSWPDLDKAVIVYYHAWTTSRHLISKLDTQEKEVHFRNPSGWPVFWWGSKERYYVEGVRAALDAPGEFYLDRTTGVLTYYPRPGEDMTTASVVAPVAGDLLRVEGDLAADKFVEYLRFEGLAFQHTAWSMPRTGAVDGQAAAFLKSATVFVRGARNCQFVGCEIAHTGGYGLWLEHGCQRNVVERCHLHDLGAGGVRLGQTALPKDAADQAERNKIINCFIHDGGHVFHAGVGVWIGRTSYNQIAHNDICDFYYTGVSVGWSWGYAPSTANHNVIEYNHIHHLGWRQLSDMGAIYCLGLSPGTQLRYNVIHDVMSYPTGYGGWGLYTDEGSTGILMENNVVYRTKDGSFHQHYGRDNIVRNNVFAFSCGRGQVVRTRNEPHRSFSFERNIVYYVTEPLLGGNWNGTDGFTLDRNIYWRTTGESPRFPGDLTLKEWQEKGHDLHSIAADPRFVAPGRYDFRLHGDSPALKVGFKPIDISTVGLTGAEQWKQLPRQVKRPPFVMPWEE